jgi:hypothetical protein
VVKILTIRTRNVQQNSIYTLRTYIFQLILSLLEDPEKTSEDFLFIMNTINYKLLEESLSQTFRRLVHINGLGSEVSEQFDNIQHSSTALTKLYLISSGDNINESIVFDKRILIKILYQIYKMLNVYATINQEVVEYLASSTKSTSEMDPITMAAFKFLHNIVRNIEYVNQND